MEALICGAPLSRGKTDLAVESTGRIQPATDRSDVRS
jgi:hypothetical protein